MFNAYNSHNAFFRSKYLGEANNAQEAETLINSMGIDLPMPKCYLGDRITIKDGQYNCTWIVAGFNIYRNRGNDTNATYITRNHIALIPFDRVPNVNPNKDYSCTNVDYIPMNSTATVGVSQNPLNPLYEITQGQEMNGYQGYWGSDMCQIHLPAIANRLQQILGDHMVPVNHLLSSNIDSTEKLTISGVWRDVYLVLMNENEFLGYTIFGKAVHDIGISIVKLPVMNFYFPQMTSRIEYWLRNVSGIHTTGTITGGSFAYSKYQGYVNKCVANYTYGNVKPIMVLV